MQYVATDSINNNRVFRVSLPECWSFKMFGKWFVGFDSMTSTGMSKSGRNHDSSHVSFRLPAQPSTKNTKNRERMDVALRSKFEYGGYEQLEGMVDVQ
jgi:hypothetical protein